MKEKVVVVTGASRGIGLATSHALADRGAHVVMIARSEDQLRQAADDVGPGALPIVADIGVPDQVRHAFENIQSTIGHLDVLINNAGSAVLTPIDEATDEQVHQSVATNLLGPIYATRASIPLMRGTGGGHIINVSSESTLLPFPFLSLYAAGKGGLETFAKAAAAELKPHGIRVTTVVCGTTMTSFGTDWDPDVTMRFLAAAQESGHLAFASAGKPMSPTEVADALVFVASRPAHQVIDLIHVRSHAAGDGHEIVDLAASNAASAGS